MSSSVRADYLHFEALRLVVRADEGELLVLGVSDELSLGEEQRVLLVLLEEREELEHEKEDEEVLVLLALRGLSEDGLEELSGFCDSVVEQVSADPAPFEERRRVAGLHFDSLLFFHGLNPGLVAVALQARLLEKTPERAADATDESRPAAGFGRLGVFSLVILGRDGLHDARGLAGSC